MDNQLYTAAQAAEKYGVTHRRIAQVCKALGFPKTGSQYVLNQEQFQQLSTVLGRTRWTKSEAAR